MRCCRASGRHKYGGEGCVGRCQTGAGDLQCNSFERCMSGPRAAAAVNRALSPRVPTGAEPEQWREIHGYRGPRCPQRHSTAGAHHLARTQLQRCHTRTHSARAARLVVCTHSHAPPLMRHAHDPWTTPDTAASAARMCAGGHTSRPASPHPLSPGAAKVPHPPHPHKLCRTHTLPPYPPTTPTPLPGRLLLQGSDHPSPC